MNQKGNMLVGTLSLYVVNPRTFTKLILPLSIQSKRKTYDVDNITPVFGFQYIVNFSVYQESKYVTARGFFGLNLLTSSVT